MENLGLMYMTKGITLTLKCLGFHPSTQISLIRLCIMFFIHNWLDFTESAIIWMDSFLQLNFSSQGFKKKGLKINLYLILSIGFGFTMMYITRPRTRLSKRCFNLHFKSPILNIIIVSKLSETLIIYT